MRCFRRLDCHPRQLSRLICINLRLVQHSQLLSEHANCHHSSVRIKSSLPAVCKQTSSLTPAPVAVRIAFCSTSLLHQPWLLSTIDRISFSSWLHCRPDQLICRPTSVCRVLPKLRPLLQRLRSARFISPLLRLLRLFASRLPSNLAASRRLHSSINPAFRGRLLSCHFQPFKHPSPHSKTKLPPSYIR